MIAFPLLLDSIRPPPSSSDFRSGTEKTPFPPFPVVETVTYHSVGSNWRRISCGTTRKNRIEFTSFAHFRSTRDYGFDFPSPYPPFGSEFDSFHRQIFVARVANALHRFHGKNDEENVAGISNGTHTYTPTYTHTHTHIDAQTHTHTHTHAHRRTHIHTLGQHTRRKKKKKTKKRLERVNKLKTSLERPSPDICIRQSPSSFLLFNWSRSFSCLACVCVHARVCVCVCVCVSVCVCVCVCVCV